MDDTETPLRGGRITAGVVRVGDSVRRPSKPNAEMRRALLGHMQAIGFAGAPRFLGVDEAGRESFSFLPGVVPDELGAFSDAQFVAAAQLLRQFHDATADFAAGLGAEVICHNDWSPTNAVFRDGLPYGLIDFDTIAPGTRLWDLGYSAFTWLDLGNPDYGADEQLRRLELFAMGYDHQGCPAAAIAVHALARQAALASWGRRSGDAALATWAAEASDWTVANIVEPLCRSGFPGV